MKKFFALLFLVFSLASVPSYGGDLILNWTDNSDNEDGFGISRAPAVTGPYVLINKTAANVQTYTDTNLADGTTFCYRVHAFNVAGDSGFAEACGMTKPRLTLTKTGTGAGTIASTPVGISCGAVCTFLFIPKASVTLTATPTAGSKFGSWSGACTGTGPCTITMDGNKTVSASFVTIPPPGAPTGLTIQP